MGQGTKKVLAVVRSLGRRGSTKKMVEQDGAEANSEEKIQATLLQDMIYPIETFSMFRVAGLFLKSRHFYFKTHK